MTEQHATIDFETYSEAGYVRCDDGRWKTVQENKSSGIATVGAWAYSEHPSTVAHCLAYSLPGQPETLWWPWMPPPLDLLQFIQNGGTIEAHNAFFEFAIWNNVMVPRLGWPGLPLNQMQCSAAKSRAWGLPGALENAVKALGLPVEKDMDGNRVMVSASKPRKATKKEPFERYTPENSPDRFKVIGDYCVQDVRAEKALSAAVPDLPAHEKTVWLVDQRINARGIQCDIELLAACREVVRQATTRYTRELVDVTGGAVQTAGEAAKIIEYCGGRGIYLPNMQEETVEATLERSDLPSDVRRVLEIRNYIGGASVKKLEAMHHRLGRDGRIRDLFVFCGATRTGRWAGAGVQPQNMVNKHPDVVACGTCRQIHWEGLHACPCCGSADRSPAEWDEDAISLAMSHIKSRDLGYIEHFWGNAFLLVMGVLRSHFCAAPGYDLIGSDFSAIEAVVLAFMAGEEWRMEVFRTHGQIYEMSASKISGVSFEEMLRHKKETGFDHPLRKKVGKVAELASGYQGWTGAWKAFGADAFMTDEEMKTNILAWRDASPMVVQFWHEVEHAAKMAIRNPGTTYRYRQVSYVLQGGVLYCILPSGRCLSYHKPRIGQKEHFGKIKDSIIFWGVDGFTKKWSEIETHGGKLTENIIQAVAGDIQRGFIVRAEAAQYWPVLHVHDEGVAEVPEGWGSVEEFEAIMTQPMDWCRDWAIRAGGGWRGKFYRKG